MKRRLWIVLATVALLAVLWCAAASADNLVFTEQPVCGEMNTANQTYPVTWKTSFLPLRTQVIYKVNLYGNEVDRVVINWENVTSAGGAWSAPVSAGGSRIFIRAYYSEEVYRDSEVITLGPVNGGFTTQPYCGALMTSRKVYPIIWTTDYMPTMVKVMERSSYYGIPTANTVATLENITSKTGYYEALGNEGGKKYFIRAYYGRDAWHDSDDFILGPADPRFTVQPWCGALNAADRTYPLTWQTSFRPVKTVVMEKTMYLGTKIDHTVATLEDIEGFNGSWPVPGDEGGERFFIRAYYGKDVYVDSTILTLGPSNPSFTVQPKGKVLDTVDNTYRITWQTDFVPTEIEIRAWDGFYDSYVTGMTENLGMNGSCPVPASYGGGKLLVRAYYGKNAWKDSGYFKPGPVDGRFTMQPVVGSLNTESNTYPITWYTDFVPTEVIIKADYELSGSGEILEWQHSGLGTRGTWNAPARYLGKRVRIWAYYGDTAYRNSQPFTVTPNSVPITLNAWGGSVNPGFLRTGSDGKPGTLPVPVREGCVFTGWYTDSTGGRKVGPDSVLTEATTLYARWIGMPAFKTQPKSGTVYPWHPLKLTWKTDRAPDRVEIGHGSGNSWIKEADVTAAPAEKMSWSLAYTDASSVDDWTVRAYYGDAGQYVESSPFSIRRATAYTCGDQVTAVFSGGTLTISGTGAMYDYGTTASTLAPWHDIWEQITEVKIEDGVTVIGKYAFFECRNVTDVYVPASVTGVRYCAFSVCTSVKQVIYGGFPEQWAAISWDSGNTKLKEAQVSWIYRKEKISGSNITWTIMGETGRLVISGSGAMPNSSPWHSYAPYLHEICVEGDVTAISSEAFRDCDAVTEVHLPKTLETIGTFAFGDCTALTDVFYDGIRTDFDQINIQAGNDPLTADTVTLHMGSVSGRLTVDLNWYLNDAGVLSIVFDGMDAEEMEIPDYSDQNSPGWQNYADQIREIRIDDGVTRIGNMAFYELTGVRRVEIPDTVTSIGDFAFIYCSALQEITIPDSVTAIGQYAFGECESLQKAVLPEGLETIRTACFEYCNSLNHIIIPETVHTIEASAFAPCTALANGGDVFFGGSRGAWLMISKGSNNAALDTAKIHYTPEEPFVDESTFPDDELRSLVSASIDTDGDGWFSEEEVSRAVSLCMEDADGLTSLEGIETLSALRSLRVNGAQGLTDADLRKNKNLTDVDLSSNGLTGLQTEGLAALAVLRVSGNALEELDVSGLALAELRCDGNPLTTLTLGSQSALKKLDCSGSSLAELNIHDCPYLIEAYYGTADTSHEGYDVYTSGSCELQVDKGTQITVGTFEINFYSYSTPFLHVSTVTGADGRVADLPVPESAGYEFDHWYYLSDEGTVTVDADTRYVRKTSVYAKWTPVPHTITVIGGTAGADEECNLTYIEIAADEKSGATFSRWTVESGGVTIQDAASASTWFIMGAEDVVIRAEFDYGGFAKQPECVINEPNKLPEGPFVYSWSLPFTPYRTEILQNGTVIDTLEDGADSRVFTPSEDEYTVRAWYDETGWVDSEPFRVELCTITFKFGYGDTYGPYTAQVPAGAVYVLPKCIFHPPVGRSGGWLGRFEGWRLADGDNVPVYRIGTTVTVTEGLTLKAKWQEEGASYVITFYSNGGEMNTVTKTWPFLVYGEPEPGTLPNWDGRGPEGYKDQLYWRTLEHLDEIYVKPSWAETSQNQGYYNYGSALPGQTYYKPQFGETNWVAAYPVWGNRYTVNFDANGAADTGMYHMSYEILKVEMGETMDYTVPECRFGPLDGYTFKGWQLGDAIFQPGEVIQTVTSDLNFKAIWYNEEEECFCLCGLTGGEPFGCGTDAENRDYRFSKVSDNTWKRLVSFEQDSFVAVKYYNGYYGDECAWYSAAAQTEAGTLLGDFGATTDPDAMVAVPGGSTCTLLLTDNGNGSYTLTVEESAEYTICSEFTGWEEVLLEYNGTTGLYEYSTELEPYPWNCRVDFQIFVNGTEYTLAEPVYDSVSGGALIPVMYEDENGDTNYRDIIALYVSGAGTYTFALDPASLTLNVTNDLETPGAFVAVDEWAVYRMTDPESGEGGEEGDEGGPAKPHIFSSGTTLWAGVFLNEGENPFRIISGGSSYGADSIILATAENQLTAGTTGQITLGEEEGDRYDFYYNPESHKLFVQKRPYVGSLRLCAWYYEDEDEGTGTALTEPWQSDYDEETEFILDPVELQYVEGDPVTVTAPEIPGYRFVRWEEGYIYHWWGSDGTEGYTLERYGDGPFSTLATLTFDISEHENLVAVYAVSDGTEVTVLFDTLGGTKVGPQVLASGETAQEPDAPMKTGAYFGGWYTDENCGEEDLFDFETPVTADLTLFAKWIVPEPAGFLKLPASLTTIEAEAFSGVAAEAVIIPETVTTIDGDPFANSAVQYIYGCSDVAEAFADAHPDYIFIPIDDSWTPGD